MAKTFKQLVEIARRNGNIEERLSYGGHYERITPQTAIAADWLFALDEAKADVAQAVRHLSSPELGAESRRAARKHLAELVAVAEAMAMRLHALE